MIIDIHAHTSEHLLYGLHTADASLNYLRREAKNYDVKKIYLMATYFPLKKSGLPNRVLLERIKGDNLFGCFGSLDMENNFLAGLAELTELAQAELISGIKLYPGYQNVDLSDPAFSPIFELAEKYQLPVACHLGELHHCCPKKNRDNGIYRCGYNRCVLEERGALSKPSCLNVVAHRFPKVNFIACHLGNPFFSSLQNSMSISPNIYTDISGQFLSGTSEDSFAYRELLLKEINRFLSLHGPDRLLFGTDFPIQSYADSLFLVKRLKLTPAITKKILFENAEKLLNTKIS